jgi:hypothetical protein
LLGFGLNRSWDLGILVSSCGRGFLRSPVGIEVVQHIAWELGNESSGINYAKRTSFY